MSRKVEFFFDFGSPASYLASTQLPRIAAECGAQIVWRPMLLGGVFKATGNASPVSVPAKGRWMFGDLARWARRYGVPLVFNPHFPLMTLGLMRAAVVMQTQQPEQLVRFIEAIFRAAWVDGRNLGESDVVAQVLTEAGLDAQRILAATADPAVKAALIASTEEAVARGAFGAPTCFVGDEMFFGQDRLDFVREALAHEAPA
jgi:2-hydroxychromene-2-carboxylate isomerase